MLRAAMPARWQPVRADPRKLPGQYLAFGFYSLVATPLLVVIFAMFWTQVRSLSALVALPSPAGDPDGSQGAIYAGRLAGAGEITPTGQQAVAWVGTVTKTLTHGRGRYTTETCRLGTIAGLRLVGAGDQRWEIRAPALRDVELELGFGGFASKRLRYRLGPTTTTSPVPESVVQRCHLDREALHDKAFAWVYTEQAAPPGAKAEVAACRDGAALSACATGAAIGHLSTPGIHAMALRLTDSTMGVMALLGYLMTFFTIVGGIGATLALRRAAIEGARAAAPGGAP
jgi:hypothetical protein